MSWIPLYITENDLASISGWLSNEEDISLIIKTGDMQWKAINEFSISSPGEYYLYHSPSGPLPLLDENRKDDGQKIQDPFSGWVANCNGANTELPFFGSANQAIFTLEIKPQTKNSIGISSFGWVGNHFRIIGYPATDSAKKWWARLGRWVKNKSVKIPRFGSSKAEIWAFEEANKQIKNGHGHATNP